MPRLDNSDPEIIEEFSLHYNDNDPGATEPIDVCWFCYLINNYDWELEHPRYELDDYVCRICGCKLTEEDNLT